MTSQNFKNGLKIGAETLSRIQGYRQSFLTLTFIKVIENDKIEYISFIFIDATVFGWDTLEPKERFEAKVWPA